MINEYKNIYSIIKKDIKILEIKENEITNKIKKLDKKVLKIKKVNNKIRDNVELVNIEKDQVLTHSINTVTSIFEKKKEKREKVPLQDYYEK